MPHAARPAATFCQAAGSSTGVQAEGEQLAAGDALQPALAVLHVPHRPRLGTTKHALHWTGVHCTALHHRMSAHHDSWHEAHVACRLGRQHLHKYDWRILIDTAAPRPPRGPPPSPARHHAAPPPQRRLPYTSPPGPRASTTASTPSTGPSSCSRATVAHCITIRYTLDTDLRRLKSWMSQ